MGKLWMESTRKRRWLQRVKKPLIDDGPTLQIQSNTTIQEDPNLDKYHLNALSSVYEVAKEPTLIFLLWFTLFKL